MDLLEPLSLGLETALAGPQLFALLVGCSAGMLVAVLPGLGPLAALSLLLPASLTMTPVAALVMMAGVYYGALFGGAISAVLVRRPGGPGSVVTCLDGYEMARRGQAGVALTLAMTASFVAGMVGTAVLALAAFPLARLAFHFGPTEYVCLMLLGLMGVAALSSGSLLKAWGVTLLGLLVGLVGRRADGPFAGWLPEALSAPGGISIVLVALGLFVIGDLVARLGANVVDPFASPRPLDATRPSRTQWRQAWPPMLRGTGLGAVLGLVPGGGAMLASFTSYHLEKRLARRGGQFGKGAVAGVAGPEAANNGGAQSAFLPLLMWGVPPNVVLALVAGALFLHGVEPGPDLMVRAPALFWGVLVSMWLGHLLLLVLNFPLWRLWGLLLSVPHAWLVPALVVLASAGAYALYGDRQGVLLLALFGAVAYALYKLHIEPAPFLLGFVLGAPLADNLREAMHQAAGDWSVFVSRPVSLGLLAVAGALTLFGLLPLLRLRRVPHEARDTVATVADSVAD